jgi:hypothetical protein
MLISTLLYKADILFQNLALGMNSERNEEKVVEKELKERRKEEGTKKGRYK